MKRILILMVVAVIGLTTMAQEPGRGKQSSRKEQREMIKSMRIGFMTEQVGLTSDQSVAFWPLYNEYEKAVREVFHQRRELCKKIQNGAATAEDVNLWVSIDKKVSEVMESYVPRFSEVLSIEQVAKMFVAEDRFKQELIRQLQKGTLK